MRLPRIPDLLTTANLSCGVASILLASQGQLTLACWLVFAGAAFDVLDGLAARALGGGSEFGKQLDSLADMVTFGVAPGMLIWFLYENDRSVHSLLAWGPDRAPMWIIPLAIIMIPVASAWRLAKFNVDARQSVGFLGLPTPANALFWASLPLIFGQNGTRNGFGVESLFRLLAAVFSNPFTFLCLSLLLGGLMLSNLPLPSLKFKQMKWKGNEVIYLLLGIGALLIVLYGILAVPLILVLYLLSPLWGKLFPQTQ